MNTALWWLGQNTIAVALLIPLVLVACRLCRNRPAVQHVLWLVVLLKFVTPPIVAWPWTAQEIQESFWPSPVVATETPDLPTEKPTAVNPVEFDPATLPSVPERLPERNVTVDLGPPADGPAVERAAGEIAVEQPDAAPTPGTQVPDRVSLADLAVRLTLGVWLGGAVLCLLGQLRRIARHAAVVRRGSAAPSQLTAEIAVAAKRLGMSPPRAVLARGILSPFMWCLGRLRLIWPEAMSSEAEIVRSRGVIAHELAHVRRGDHWVAWLELSAGIVWWWNPLFWLVRRRLRETAEMACDAVAISANPESRREYAELLLELSAGFKTGAPAPVLAVSAGTPSSFERRLSMILSDRVSGKMSWWGLLAAILFALVALPGWSLGQDQPPSVTKTPPALTPNPLITPPEVSKPADPAGAPDKVPPTAKDPRFTPDLVKPADPAAAADKLDVAAIEVQIKKLEDEIRRLHKMLADRKAATSPKSDPNSTGKNDWKDEKRKSVDEALDYKAKVEAEYRRLADLFKQGVINKEQLDAARASVDKAMAILKQLEAKAPDTKPATNDYFPPKKTEPKSPNNPSTTPTPPTGNQEREVTFFSLQFGRAKDVARMLKDLFPEDEASNPRITGDERSNSLIIRGTAKDRDTIEGIVNRLEKSAAEKLKKEESEGKPPRPDPGIRPRS
jgi:beta-lactamase regulating signal transducer with metallopeptidase domain